MLFDGVIGEIGGAIGGEGMLHEANISTLNSRLTSKVISKSWSDIARGIEYYISQTGTLYYKKFWHPTFKVAVYSSSTSAGKRIYSECR